MARHSLPGSLDLLLDTMCNTFGGVMFIALSMIITLLIAQQKLTPESQREAEKKLLEARRKENQLLVNRHKYAAVHLKRLKNLTGKDKQSSTSDLPEQVARLKQEVKDVSRKNEMIREEIAILTEKNDKLAGENVAKSAEIRRKQNESDSRRQKYEHENALLDEQLKNLRIQLSNTPVKELHFARNVSTSLAQYFIIIENGILYRAGPIWSNLGDATFEKLDKSRVRIVPKRGVLVNAIRMDNIGRYLDTLDPMQYYAFVLVEPRMMAAFVPIRRMLREYGCKVHWELAPDYVLYLTSSSSKSASD